MANCGICDSQMYCPTHRPAPYGHPQYQAPITTVTQREVPVLCEVCRGRGFRPEDPDDIEGSWIECRACHRQGWLKVVETITTTHR